MTNIIYFLGILLISAVQCKVTPDVKCSSNLLDISISKDGVKDVQLEKWGAIPGCQFTPFGKTYRIQLSLSSDLPCGTTRIKNKLTGDALYYHKMTVVDDTGRTHLLKVSCLMSPSKGLHSNIVKRNVLPPEFVEPDYIEITSEVTGTAPIPELSVGVRQNGNLIGDQVTVSPGAPLSMEVYLDSGSSSTYGILVSYMMVTDTSNKNETIIFNGCTQDQYLFENFETKDGDFLTAKFRAFKFPESSYLFFKGTVDVCLDKCQGIQCSNGEIGYGRRKRSVPHGADANKIFEVTMMTFIKLEDEQDIISDSSSPFIRRGLTSDNSQYPSYTYEREIEPLQTVERTHGPPPPPPFIIFRRSSSSLPLSSLILLTISLATIKLFS